MKIISKYFSLDISNSGNFISQEEIKSAENEIKSAFADLTTKKGKGNDFLGWLDLPSKINNDEITAIEETAHYLRRKSKIIVVIGIGGSYLGARAVTEALNHSFKFLLKRRERFPSVLFSGQNISEDYHRDLLDILDSNKYSVIIISKSGTTTEPAIAFRLIKEHIEKKYGKEVASKRIIAITDREKGALRKLATSEGYKTFIIPDDVGGRFSVLTPVGLLPISTAGIDIRKIIQGARETEEDLLSSNSIDNPAILYALTRNLLYRKGKTTEILSTFNPSLYYFIEWWKQLFGESEGKEGKGIFPSGAVFTTDLHSMGQWIQEGQRNIFETVINTEESRRKLLIPEDKENLDGMNYLSGKSLSYVNLKASEGTVMAHKDGGVPVMEIKTKLIDEYTIGSLIYFFEFACALSGYMLGVNPFDQPGVEAYKKNMFTLLGKK